MLNQVNSHCGESERVIPAFWIFVFIFLLIAVLKSSQWFEPPFWDAAFSVFPAAITLVESDFDFPALFSSPEFVEGGPNVYGASLVTLVTALVLKVMPTPEGSFLILHFINYLLAALTISCLYRWSVPLLGGSLAILTAIATLMFPLFVTQAGQMYLDMPLACTAILALTRFHSRKYLQATIWAAVSVWIKESGIIVAGSLALASLLLPNLLTRRILLASGMAAPAILVATGHFLTYTDTGIDPDGSVLKLLNTAWYYFIHVPDLLVLVALSTIISCAMAIPIARQLHGEESDKKITEKATIRILLYSNIFIFLAFFLSISKLGWIHILPRYFIFILPTMMTALADASLRLFGPRLVAGGMILSILVSCVNYHGRLYSRIVSSGAIAERSNEYVDLLASHIDVARATEKVAGKIPVLYGRYHHYFVSYPSMGYVRNSIPNGHFVELPGSKYHSASLDQLPNHFYLVLGYYGPNAIKNAAEADPRYEVTTQTFKHGHYASHLVEIRLRGLPNSK